MSKDYVIVNGELYHYGVPGMKWGQRKSTSGSENKVSQKIAKRAKAYEEESLKYASKTYFEKPSAKTFVRNMLISPYVREAWLEAKVDAKKDRLDRAIKKAKKKGYKVDVKTEDNLKTGKAVVEAIIKDKEGNTYSSGYDGEFNPYLEKKKNKK